MFKVISGYIEMEGNRVAKILDKADERTVREEIEGIYFQCDCDEVATYEDGAQEGHEKAIDEIEKILDALLKKGKLSQSNHDDIMEELP